MSGPTGTSAEMFLYNVTVQKPGAITHAVFGNFSKPKAQEIVVARGHLIELLRPNDESGKVETILSWEVFGVVRSLLPFRLAGSKTDQLVVGSDSGRIVIIRYDADSNQFIKVHEETYGRTGCRRIVPGQYLATDPKGRAVMISAIEKMKFVYVLNRDAANNLTISSPLEAHKSNIITYSTVGLDVGYDNPCFACIEVDYEDEEDAEDSDEDMKGNNEYVPSKYLTIYELDLGLNHVTRKYTDEVDAGANLLMPVPGGQDGPGGVLVCTENWIIHKNIDTEEVRAPIPRRLGTIDDSKGVMIVSYAMHKQKNLFFFLAQSEHGDIYKVTLQYEDTKVVDVNIKYFDSVPPTVAMCVLKTGFLFCASEFGNHYLFQFQGIGDDEDIETSSATVDPIPLIPRALKNLALIDEMDSLSPITDMTVEDLALEGAPQIYALSGTGARSALRVLRHGLAVTEMAVSDLPGNPNAIWAVKTDRNDPYHTYIVVSFVNATIVLSIGETVTEVSDSGILDDTQTLCLSTLGENSLLQIHPNGLRHIRNAHKKEHMATEWKCPAQRTVVQCAVNDRQAVIALNGGELVYFELDKTGRLLDVGRHEMGNDVSCLSLAPVPEGRLRTPFLAVGSMDSTVRILSLDPQDPLKQMTLQALPAKPSSVVLSRMEIDVGGNVSDSKSRVFLHVGMENGVSARSVLDTTTGSLQDMRKKFLGTKAVKLFEVQVNGKSAVMALSSRSWLSYTHEGKYHMNPLSYQELEHCSSFSSEYCAEGIVAISGSTLRIASFNQLGEMFNHSIYPLNYTPRKMLVEPQTQKLVIIEADHNAYSKDTREEIIKIADNAAKEAAEPQQKRARTEPQEEEDDEEKKAQEEFTKAMHGHPKAGAGKWGSCVRIFDPVQAETTFIDDLQDNECACSLSFVTFTDPAILYLAVGTCKDLTVLPRSMTCGYIRIYKVSEDRKTLQFVHKTEVEAPPLALAGYQGRLLAGVGTSLRLYELGKQRLLRKCENKTFPTLINTLYVRHSRIYVGDIAESFFLVKYRPTTKVFHVFADCTSPRYLTASCLVDYDTVAGSDKFGTVFLSRLPADASEDVVDHMSTTTWGNTLTKGAPNKMYDIVNYYVGDVVTSLKKVNLGSGTELLFYSTISGGLGCFVPFTSHEDVDFFNHLEMHLRQENPPLCGRDHLAYRSFYFPVKQCVDGDLCEQFRMIPAAKQTQIAEELMSTPAEVVKRLEELRNRIM